MAKNKNNKNERFIPMDKMAEYSLVISVISNPLVGFDPNKEYAVSDEYTASKMPTIPRDIKKIQESIINLEQSIADSIVDSKKYIYDIEPRIYKEDGIHKCKVYVLKMVQKTDKGVIPSVLILSNSEEVKEGYKVQKSAFSACLNGKKYITLDRIDAHAQFKHENYLLDYDGNIRDDNRKERRYIRARLSHRHIYRQSVLLNRSKSIWDNYGYQQQDSKLKTYSFYRLDAYVIKQIESFQEIIDKNLHNLNICPFIFNDIVEMANENAPLSEIYNKCSDMEMNFPLYQKNVRYNISRGTKDIDLCEKFIEY